MQLVIGGERGKGEVVVIKIVDIRIDREYPQNMEFPYRVAPLEAKKNGKQWAIKRLFVCVNKKCLKQRRRRQVAANICIVERGGGIWKVGVIKMYLMGLVGV